MGPILGGWNIFALSLCLYLLVKAKLKTDEQDPYLKASVSKRDSLLFIKLKAKE